MAETEISGTLTPEQLKELQDLCGDLIGDAEKVREDYESNPSDMSGSVISIHEDSPYLDEEFSDTGWKYVLKTKVTGEDVLENLNKKDVVDKEKNDN